MTAPHDPDAGQARPGRRRSSSRRWLRATAAVLLLVLLAAGVDVAVLSARMGAVEVDLTADDRDGSTWVLLGLDSRAALPRGADAAAFGTTEEVPGSRADVVLVVHRSDAGTRVLSVPRDLLVTGGGQSGRLALTWLRGPGATVAALCGLGIPTDHLVTVDLAGFTDLVDAVGGVEVDLPGPVRDPQAGLLLPRGGAQELDGATALALVRSRHPETPADGGGWAPSPVDPDARAATAAGVLRAFADRAAEARTRPWRLQRVAWAASGAVSRDPGTSLADLASFAGTELGTAEVLPAGPPVEGALLRLPTPATAAAVAAAGLSCGG
ncbi:LCP family protein [Blastococcus sp. TML/M2B]|uniref:LCP family protein n=1 Tax=unclassified Blastococcus TaxID=2619396 RepID=UPI00190D4E40|nr:MULTISPECIES: LCP family protein [unclassified Blastococcus]MBN1093526.1 LCP family protein [Blastococcus sp. TML/M2B]MBN1096361.1 LCP family protein [Blastococcus sp. TML/C7B]